MKEDGQLASTLENKGTRVEHAGTFCSENHARMRVILIDTLSSRIARNPLKTKDRCPSRSLHFRVVS